MACYEKRPSTANLFVTTNTTTGDRAARVHDVTHDAFWQGPEDEALVSQPAVFSESIDSADPSTPSASLIRRDVSCFISAALR
jgi:hypothetical protein